jgi:ribosomal-protein-alanine N-acetyltransferase
MILEIRNFRYEDLDQVIAIENGSFPNPYSRLLFLQFKLRADDGFIVARRERVVGYAITEIREGRGHIISMAVSPAYRRTGIGEALLREVIRRLEARVRETCLEVRVGNEAAINLYEKFSFRRTGEVRERYYPNGEAAIILARHV